MKEKQKLLTQQAELLLTVLNQQRHDWLNHFQVLLGYLKLGRPEKGEEYLRSVTEEAHRESMVARLQCPPLSVFFLTYNALHHKLRLEVEVCNEVDLSLLQTECNAFCGLVIDYVDVIESHITHTGESPHLLITFLAEDDHVVLKFDLAGNLPTSGLVEMEKLLERSTSLGASISDIVHTDKEWILELRFPTT